MMNGIQCEVTLLHSKRHQALLKGRAVGLGSDPNVRAVADGFRPTEICAGGIDHNTTMRSAERDQRRDQPALPAASGSQKK